VVWAGMEGADQLGIISGKLNECLADLGFEPETRKFSPHITIARVKGGRNKEKVKQAILDYQNVEFGEQPVTSIKLKKSVLTPQGPVYSDVVEVRLIDKV
jgi:2'-5' RNA ligase